MPRKFLHPECGVTFGDPHPADVSEVWWIPPEKSDWDPFKVLRAIRGAVVQHELAMATQRWFRAMDYNIESYLRVHAHVATYDRLQGILSGSLVMRFDELGWMLDTMLVGDEEAGIKLPDWETLARRVRDARNSVGLPEGIEDTPERRQVRPLRGSTQ